MLYATHVEDNISTFTVLFGKHGQLLRTEINAKVICNRELIIMELNYVAEMDSKVKDRMI